MCPVGKLSLSINGEKLFCLRRVDTNKGQPSEGRILFASQNVCCEPIGNLSGVPRCPWVCLPLQRKKKLQDFFVTQEVPSDVKGKCLIVPKSKALNTSNVFAAFWHTCGRVTSRDVQKQLSGSCTLCLDETKVPNYSWYCDISQKFWRTCWHKTRLSLCTFAHSPRERESCTSDISI